MGRFSNPRWKLNWREGIRFFAGDSMQEFIVNG